MSESPRSNNSKVNATDVDVNSTKTTGVALDLKANSVDEGVGLKVSATAITTGSAVEITGKAATTALNVTAGDVKIAGALTGYRKEVLRQTVFTTAIELTVAQSGALVLLDKNEATTITLPPITSADIGVTYTIMQTVISDLLRKIVTKYDNDYFVGGVTNLFDAAGDTDDAVQFVSAGGTDTTIVLGDNDLANAGGGLGAMVTLTAILTGNTGASGGAKLVWAVTGNKVAQALTDTGAAFFA
jgi:hypothetical protein